MRVVSIANLDDVAWGESLLLFCMHVACLTAFWTGVTWNAILLCAAM